MHEVDADDCVVKYALFPKIGVNLVKNELIKHQKDVIDDYLARLSPFLSQYLWQNESFRLGVVPGETPYLNGATNYGDNIEDEWFIVFLLLELTKTDPDLVIKVEDTDGEFLLIEAADYLPKWLDPETCENRVYLYRGKLHIVPLAQSPAEVTPIPSGTPEVKDAVEAVRNHSMVTTASNDIQESLYRRISEYPGKVTSLHHMAQCYVPAAVASILKYEPQLVSGAVQAFCLRDPIDLQACRAMRFFPPETRVLSLVKFTRCLYAQLVGQKFEPDKRVGWNLPPPNSILFKSHSLGMKLACGMEILTSSAKKSDSKMTTNVDPDDLSNDLRWKNFIDSLKNNGYFKGELEGSRLYTKLLSEARQFFCRSAEDVANASRGESSEGARILSLLRNLEIDYEPVKEGENLPPEDDDNWMNLTPDNLESILEEYASGMSSNAQNIEESHEEVAFTLTSSIKNFIEQKSDVEGVDVTRRIKHNNNNKKAQQRDSTLIHFEADKLADAVSSILDFKTPESDGESSSSMSGYSDEEEEELRPPPTRPPRKKDLKTKATMDEMRTYLNQMDKELASTDVGLSFERELPSTVATNGHRSTKTSDDDVDNETDEFQPVSIDLTLLKNLLESYNSQQGLPGPTSTLLQSMGIALPDNND